MTVLQNKKQLLEFSGAKTRICEQCHNDMRWVRVSVCEWGWVTE